MEFSLGSHKRNHVQTLEFVEGPGFFNPYCPVCGKRSPSDSEAAANRSDCDHLSIIWLDLVDEPVYDRDHLFAVFENEPTDDESFPDYLERELGSDYFEFLFYQPMPSGAAARFIYKIPEAG